jgi:hypothetical protein
MLRPGHFTPGKETHYPLYRRLSRPQGMSGRVLKISPPLGFDPRTAQLIASRYTDYAILAQDTFSSNMECALDYISALYAVSALPVHMSLSNSNTITSDSTLTRLQAG